MTTKRDKTKYPMYRDLDVNSKEGKAFAKKYNVTTIPTIQKCRIKSNGTRGHCRLITGWNKEDW